MKVLAVSDRVVSHLYTPAVRERLGPVDLIIACGDLPAGYLEFLLTVLDAPLLYVPGNHDPDRYHVPGGTPLDGRQVRVKGLRALGLGGSRRYKPRGRHQYTEGEMHLRLFPHLPALALRRLRRGRGCDLLVTHAPPLGVHDRADPAHRGFLAFRRLIRLARPAWMLHGHCHLHRNLETAETLLGDTRVVNVYPYRLLDVGATGVLAARRKAA